MILRKNLSEFLEHEGDDTLGVLLEAVADELLVRGHPFSSSVREYGWRLLKLHVGRGGNLPPIYSGDCVPVKPRGGPA